MTVPLPDLFRRVTLAPGGVRINAFVATNKGNASGTPVLLLHGYPQTHVMWHHVAPVLAESHPVVLTDLRGSGDSGKPPGGPAHDAYAKRTLAYDQIQVMRELGYERFAVVGHDRGARTAHRMALDYQHVVTKLAILDIVPTRHVLHSVDKAVAQSDWHWFFLAQPEPLPEHLIGADPIGWLRSRLSDWRGGGEHFDPQAVAEYTRCFNNPAAIHATCEDYRAGLGTDLADDDAAAARGQRVTAPTLALWGEHGFVGRHYGDITEIWRDYADNVTGHSLPCGHFLAEECPKETTAALQDFLAP
jgi:haloacetate dehalogenase